MILEHFSQGHIERFNGIGGVNGLANFWWECKEQNDSDPVIHPGAADGRVLLIPLRGKRPQLLCGFRLF